MGFNFFRLPHWKKNTFYERVDNITQIVCRTFYNFVHAFRHSYDSLALCALKKETIQNMSRVSAFENHNFIRARSHNAGCKTGFPIPVSETKIHGSRETAGEVGRRAWYLVDKLDRISRIPLRISTRSHIWSATADTTRKCSYELRATPHSSASRNFEEKIPIKKSVVIGMHPIFHKEDRLCKCNNRYRGVKREKFTGIGKCKRG